eukprot:5391685-Amphidinium_carterae.1
MPLVSQKCVVLQELDTLLHYISQSVGRLLPRSYAFNKNHHVHEIYERSTVCEFDHVHVSYSSSGLVLGCVVLLVEADLSN